MSKGSALIGGQELNAVFQENASQGHLFQRIINSVNSLTNQFGLAARGKVAPPPPIDSMAVKVSGELAHVQLQHYPEIQKGVHYFVEYDTNPSFTQPHVEHLGASRTRILNLPTKDDSGNTVNYYLRAYPQYPGSDPQKPTLYGGTSPVAVNMAGTTQLTLLTSTGSGTAVGTGGQGGSGFGKVLIRPASAPKRAL